MASIGIVCEGSHDFCFLEHIVDELLIQQGIQGNSFVSLQPRIDATSAQLGQGGYEAVYQWLVANSGIGLRKFFINELFSTSELYDAIVVQMDGDVADISADFKASPFNQLISDVVDRVSYVRSWMLSAAKVEPALAPNMLCAVPTLQTEAWIVAALRPNSPHIEDRNRKSATKRFLRKQYAGTAVQLVKQAGSAARSQVGQMQAKAVSFSMFCDDLHIRFQTA